MTLKRHRRPWQKAIVLGIAATLLSGIATAQTLRPDHWLTDQLQFEQFRGRLWEFSPQERPIRLQDWHQLDSMLVDDAGPYAPFVARRQDFFRHLPAETENLLIWVHSRNRFERDDLQEQYAGRQILTLGMPVTDWLDAYTSVLADNRIDEEPGYLGKEQGGLAGYTEQAYVQAVRGGFSAKVGRDFLSWGPGRDATLLISQVSRPLDQIAVGFDGRWFAYRFFTASLDPLRETVAGERVRYNRYLSGHRLEIRPMRFLRIGINEALLLGGRDQGYSLTMINPVIFFHGEQMNGPDGGNSIGSIDATWMPMAHVTVYGNLMIDDIQLEKSGPGDLEPDQIGFTIGTNWADPFYWTGMDWFAEYTRVANRTYNGQGGSWEKWLHRRQPLGHFLGNDFDRILLGMRFWPKPQWFCSLTYEHRRRGEGRIEKPFDTPWMDVPIGQEYHEPFPFGIVESTDRVDCELNWMPFAGIHTRLALYWMNRKNIENRLGVERSDWGAWIELRLDLIRSVRL